MQVEEIKVKIYILKSINKADIISRVTEYIDTALCTTEYFKELHKKREFKYYCFDCPVEIPKDGIYREGRIYTFRIRTLKEELIRFFKKNLANHYTEYIKGLTCESKTIPKRQIEKIYSLTPVIVKNPEFGYWKKNISFDEYENLLKVNLIKKYNYLTGNKIDENFDLWNSIEITNTMPIAMKYKGIKLLGDKLDIYAADNETAQELIYMSLATAIGNNCQRGAGFMNYKFL